MKKLSVRSRKLLKVLDIVRGILEANVLIGEAHKTSFVLVITENNAGCGAITANANTKGLLCAIAHILKNIPDKHLEEAYPIIRDTMSKRYHGTL